MPKEEWTRLCDQMKAQGELVEKRGYKLSINKDLLPRMKELCPDLPFEVESDGWVNRSGNGQGKWAGFVPAVKEVFTTWPDPKAKSNGGLGLCTIGWMLKVRAHTSLSHFSHFSHFSGFSHFSDSSDSSLSLLFSLSLSQVRDTEPRDTQTQKAWLIF